MGMLGCAGHQICLLCLIEHVMVPSLHGVMHYGMCKYDSCTLCLLPSHTFTIFFISRHDGKQQELWCSLCRTNSSTGHIHADKSSSTASKIIETVSNALPSREVLQQAHPGVAAAAGLLLGQASSNKAGDQDGSKLNSQPAQAASNTPVSAERGQDSIGEIPWRQVAGLLHAQGITDPQGLVSLALLSD